MERMDCKQKAIRNVKDARTAILETYPFYAELIMYMKFGVAECETAFTDGKSIVFDPEFIADMTLEEVCFILQHEILHCVLHHLTRGKGLLPYTYNVACDIVVNSNILNTMGLDELVVGGAKVMHKAPNGEDGFLYTAEEVYAMLLEEYGNEEVIREELKDALKNMDNHSIWEEIENVFGIQGEWDNRVSGCLGRGYSKEGTPYAVRKMYALEEDGKLDWRNILREFVVTHKAEYDYTSLPPNRNYIYMDLAYPQFNEVDMEQINGIHFFVDTSGSISNQTLQIFMTELKSLTTQFQEVNFLLSFFDVEVSEPIVIDSGDAVEKAVPVGGGGTSFECIFRYLGENYANHLPKGVVILTDGYAEFPEESETLNIPILWIICESQVVPPYGKYVKYEE